MFAGKTKATAPCLRRGMPEEHRGPPQPRAPVPGCPRAPPSCAVPVSPAPRHTLVVPLLGRQGSWDEDERGHDGKRKINPSGPWAVWGSTAGAVQGEQTPSDTCSQDTTAGPQPGHAPRPPQTLFSPGRGWPRVPAPSGVRAGPWGRGEGKNQKKIAAVNGAEPRRPRRLQRDFDSPIITPN